MTSTSPPARPTLPIHPPGRPAAGPDRWGVRSSWANAAFCIPAVGAGCGPRVARAGVLPDRGGVRAALAGGRRSAPAGNPALQFAGLLVACAAALGCYALAVRLGEGRGAPRARAAAGAVRARRRGGLGLLMMAILMGVLAVTGLYDITLVGPAPAWAGLGLALQAAVTEELWMRALLLRLLWRAFGPLPAFAVSALVFAALHLANPGATVLAGATVAMAGLMFCALFALTGRLWVPIGLHLAWNFAQGYLFGAAVSGGDLGGSIAVSTARPGWTGMADRRNLRPGGFGVRPDPGQRR